MSGDPGQLRVDAVGPVSDSAAALPAPAVELTDVAEALRPDLAPALGADIAALVLASVVASIVLHGISVTPLMALYERRKGRPRKA